MAKKVKKMLKNNVVLCVLILAAIGLTSIVFAADVVVKQGAITATKVDSLAAPTDANDAARKKYVDDGAHKASDGSVTTGYRYCSVNDGAVQKVFTKYFTGTLDSDSSTNIAHGCTAANILSVTTIVYQSYYSKYFVWDMYLGLNSASAFNVTYDATNIIIGSVGSTIQGQVYRIRIDYTI
ncbi:MAG: hypothetical protein ACYSSI_11580 [Planctomycetota bacterium]|jgi:hypothetical protein